MQANNNMVQVESRMDWKRLSSTTMANHNDAWRCPLPFYMEDWAHRAKKQVRYGNW